ncbi:mucin TcMUCII [Trypanosoma cruzi Dm28c]|uniref:Mucin TcMUCII n=1 Tax=Trypanosoma cruzi Dm28c TaxID=1416333 RepID=V5ANK4_TRYCR|nr:mucin TcMUCII [Trypanosoma cruzi Dm28c]
MDQALPPPPHHGRHGLLIPDGPRETPPHPLRECPRRWESGMRLFVTAPPRTTEYMPLLYGRPLRYSLVIVAAYKQNRITSCFVVNIGCTSRGPTIRMVCGDLSLFVLLLCFCVAVCAAPLLVCVRTLREGCRHDGPLSRYVHAVEPCVPLLFASPSSICVLLLRQGCVCVCLLPWNGVCVLCAAYGACLAAALSSCGVPSVCVCCTSRLSCCSPFPSLCRSAPHH